MKLGFFFLIYNNEPYMKILPSIMEKIEKKYDVYYYFYENNSKDKTAKEIRTFMKTRKGNFQCEILPNPKIFNGGILIERSRHMARLRNKLKKLCSKEVLESFQYVFLVDSDVFFSSTTIDKMITSFQNHFDCVMLSTFGICYLQYHRKKQVKNLSKFHYYDSLAFIAEDGRSYKETKNRCLFKSCQLCQNFLKRKTCRNFRKECLMEINTSFEVQSAFGSMSLCKPSVFQIIDYNPTSSLACEHHDFCKKVQEYGKIIVDASIFSFITNPRLRNCKQLLSDLEQVEKEMEQTALKFN